MDPEKQTTVTAFSGFSLESVKQNPFKFINLGLRILVLVFVAVDALCAVITIAMVKYQTIEIELNYIIGNTFSVYGYGYNTDWRLAVNFVGAVCGALLLVTCFATFVPSLVLLIVMFRRRDNDNDGASPNIILVCVETVLGAISAVVFFSLSVTLANSYSSAGVMRLYTSSSLISAGQAASAFGFLSIFALIAKIVSLWIKFYYDKSQANRG